MARTKIKSNKNWYAMDLHLHTPSSSDYKQENVDYLDILQRSESRGLDIIAFSDHNTLAGYRKLYSIISQLELLKSLNRILPEEDSNLKEYNRLLGKILVLPGFEFTATFGFHILGIFSPDKPLREIEHLLLDLNIPPEQLDDGIVTAGASSDVLKAYELINSAGGMAIAAHANSSNGVAMRGFAFGGQTKIAYTQDPNLIALEVTDLGLRGRRSTSAFFSGIKPEYPRKMHCIQGSDAHRLDFDPKNKKHLGVGDRVTEVYLPEVSFDALRNMFQTNDFARTRPRRKKKGEVEIDFIGRAREEGGNIIQDFHSSMSVRGGNLYTIIADVCSFANTNGGTLYVGVDSNPKTSVQGINNPKQAIKQLEDEIANRISPPLSCTVDLYKSGGKNVLRILVPRGDDPPYALDDNKIYIRQESETNLAVRDEIVGLVRRGDLPSGTSSVDVQPVSLVAQNNAPETDENNKKYTAPKTGVEITSVSDRNGTSYYKLKDLRNGNVVKNVTAKSARKLWHYAITEFAKMPTDRSKINASWHGDLGLVKSYKQGKSQRFDLVQKQNGNIRIYFGVTEDGIDENWRQVVGLTD